MSKYYHIHNNVDLRKGGRKIAKMTEKQFAEKAKKFILDTCKNDSWTVEYAQKTDSPNKLVHYLPSAIRTIICQDKKKKTTIGKDFKGIEPDWENYDLTGGLRTVNGAPYVIMEVGGDWEVPVAVFIYHDGKEFRCYIPKKGNPYRDDLKICLGNYDADYDPNTETYSDEIKSKTYKKVIPSDDKYVFDSLVKDGILDKEKDKDKMRGIGRYVTGDLKGCIEDFSSRVEVISLKENKNVNYNKSLYESIINNVAKQVKQILEQY